MVPLIDVGSRRWGRNRFRQENKEFALNRLSLRCLQPSKMSNSYLDTSLELR